MTALQPEFDSKAFDASALVARQTLYALTGALRRSEQILLKVLAPAEAGPAALRAWLRALGCLGDSRGQFRQPARPRNDLAA